MVRERIQHILNPNRPRRIRRSAGMDMSCSTYIALFDTQKHINKEYIERSKKRSVKMEITYPEQLEYLLGEGWHQREWAMNSSGDVTNCIQILFPSTSEASIIEMR